MPENDSGHHPVQTASRRTASERHRQQILGVYRFFERIRERLPDLVIENCSSGGHRLEPSMLARTAMSSFSDAHELVEIPIIAATFLGRMCLSGEIKNLTAGQWSLVEQATALYRRVAPIIKHGTSRAFGEIGASWRHPSGWQAVVRMADDQKTALVVMHAFARAPTRVEIPLPGAQSWRVAGHFPASADSLPSIHDGGLILADAADFSGQVVLLERA